MARHRIVLYVGHCERCGRGVTTTSRSVLGLDGLKREIGVICATCYTPDEKARLNLRIGEAVAQGR